APSRPTYHLARPGCRPSTLARHSLPVGVAGQLAAHAFGPALLDAAPAPLATTVADRLASLRDEQRRTVRATASRCGTWLSAVASILLSITVPPWVTISTSPVIRLSAASRMAVAVSNRNAVAIIWISKTALSPTCSNLDQWKPARIATTWSCPRAL